MVTTPASTALEMRLPLSIRASCDADGTRCIVLIPEECVNKSRGLQLELTSGAHCACVKDAD